MTERELEACVVRLAGLFWWRVYHTRDSRGSAKGFPDLTMVRPPRLVFAELKSERGRLTIEQAEWLRAIEDTFGKPETYVWRPADWMSGAIEELLK